MACGSGRLELPPAAGPKSCTRGRYRQIWAPGAIGGSMLKGARACVREPAAVGGSTIVGEVRRAEPDFQHQRIGWDVVRDGGTGPHHGAFANRDSADDRGVGADARTPADERGNHLPVSDLQEFPFVIDRRRIAVVREANMRPDKHTVLDRDARGNEDERLDLHVSAEHHSTLDLDERRDFAVAADLATKQIHLVGVMHDDVRPELHIWRDHAPHARDGAGSGLWSPSEVATWEAPIIGRACHKAEGPRPGSIAIGEPSRTEPTIGAGPPGWRDGLRVPGSFRKVCPASASS